MRHSCEVYRNSLTQIHGPPANSGRFKQSIDPALCSGVDEDNQQMSNIDAEPCCVDVVCQCLVAIALLVCSVSTSAALAAESAGFQTPGALARAEGWDPDAVSVPGFADSAWRLPTRISLHGKPP